MSILSKNLYLSLLLIILCESSLFGQLKYTFSQFGSETASILKQPAKWEGSDYLKFGLIGATSFLLMQTADEPVRSAVLRDQNRYFKSVPIEFGRMWGELYAPVVFFSGFAIHSLIADDIGTRKIAYEIGQASLYAGALTYFFKVAFGRARPYTNEGHSSFHPFSFSDDFHSSPGGHNAAAFTISTVLSRNVKPTWLKVLVYLPATLTFVSRVYQDKHWTSDDFSGAALGYIVATWVVDLHENNKSPVEMSSIYPLSIRIAL